MADSEHGVDSHIRVRRIVAGHFWLAYNVRLLRREYKRSAVLNSVRSSKFGNRIPVSKTLAVIVVLLLAANLHSADKPRFTRKNVEIDVPDVTLINQDGDEVGLRELLLGDKPVFAEFIFATCTTICPVLSAGFSSMQRRLGDDREQVLLVSLTIDPEHDGPEELTEYLERYGAKSGWDFLTGTRGDIDLVMKGFDAFVPDKMSHQPLTFIRSPGTGQWVRIYGFAGSADLLEELRKATGK
jgi:protein SCO1/2